MAMSEIQDAAEIITSAVAPDANIIFGASIRPELEDEIVVTVVATGFDSEYYRKLDAERAETLTVGEMTGQSEMAEPSTSYGNMAMNGQSSSTASRYGDNNYSSMPETPAASVAPVTETTSADFTAEPRANMWDSIRTEPEDDLDVPPSLRERLRNKGKE